MAAHSFRTWYSPTDQAGKADERTNEATVANFRTPSVNFDNLEAPNDASNSHSSLADPSAPASSFQKKPRNSSIKSSHDGRVSAVDLARFPLKTQLESLTYEEGEIKQIPQNLLNEIKAHHDLGGDIDYSNSLWPQEQTLNQREGRATSFNLDDAAKTPLTASRFTYQVARNKGRQIILVQLPPSDNLPERFEIVVPKPKVQVKDPRNKNVRIYLWQVWKPRYLRDTAYESDQNMPRILRMFAKYPSIHAAVPSIEDNESRMYTSQASYVRKTWEPKTVADDTSCTNGTGLLANHLPADHVSKDAMQHLHSHLPTPPIPKRKSENKTSRTHQEPKPNDDQTGRDKKKQKLHRANSSTSMGTQFTTSSTNLDNISDIPSSSQEDTSVVHSLYSPTPSSATPQVPKVSVVEEKKDISNTNVKFVFKDNENNTKEETKLDDCRSATDLFDIACESGVASKATRMLSVQINEMPVQVLKKDRQESFQKRLMEPLNQIVSDASKGKTVVVTVKEYM